MPEDPGGSLHARPADRFLALDSLRGVCAVLIALFHFQTTGWIHNAPLVAHAYMVVDFFFILSGFVIAASYGTRLAEGFAVGRFMLLRLGRIYPLHAAVLVLTLAKTLGGQLSGTGLSEPFTGEYSLAEWVYGMLFIQIFVGTDETRWNAPTWSIAAEMWTYLLAAGLFRAAGRRIAPAVLVAALVAFAGYVAMLDAGYGAHHWAALPRCLASFCLGVFGFHALAAWRRRAPAPLPAGWATVAEIAALLAAGLAMVENAALAGPFVFLPVILIFACQAGRISRLLLTRPMLLLGTLSYSIYMVQSLVQSGLIAALIWALRHNDWADGVLIGTGIYTGGDDPLRADVVTLAMVALVVAVAWATYHLIERPGQRWSRAWLLPRRAEMAEERAPTF